MKLTQALAPSAKYVTAVLSSAAFWALILTIGGAAAASVGAGVLWGTGAGLISAGAFSVVYGLTVLKGMTNG